MKEIRTKVSQYFDQLNTHWKSLPIQKQQHYTLYIFIIYLILTAGLICKIWFDAGTYKEIALEQFENPIPIAIKNQSKAMNSLVNFSKNKNYV
ncbi:nitrogen regulatory IIA protein [Flavobacterium sp. xlx-214]|uniref:nitrogen regulatory IIA protein n=1 Tax=unclassified Flavobacterium TaxID=196869 RepID=UPI0013CFC100|nr:MULTISPECIES: nitrogen regulatory IIA protein [unclassified Flavobacterium]MBA5793477.1 nitrogen regulatory IIA protein [Flavobacterium sp. xlx-221]QMI82752.1 nitrogen regulatory IIA protein [Flavobacterium sp. xlx-214]